MKDIDYEEILNYISLILALIILIIILYRYFFNSQIENFETEKVNAEGKAIVSAISEITIIKKGTGYKNGETSVEIDEPSSGGTKAKADITINEDGEIDKISITNGGKGYDPEDPPIVKIVGSGKDEEVVAVVGAVSEINITNRGKGYTATPTINFGSKPSGENSIIASAKAVIDETSGEVKEIIMETGGAGYEEDFEITFQTPQEAEETLNPIIKIEADKKKEILELLNQCDKVNNEKKEHIIRSINENKLKKLEVEEMISILNK